MRKNLYCYPLYGVAARLLLSVFFLLTTIKTHSKEALYSFSWDKISAKQAFKQVETKASVKFAYNPLEIDVNKQLNLVLKNQNLEQVVYALAGQLKAKYQIKGSMVIMQPEELSLNKNKPVIQNNIVKGRVLDNDGQPLPGVLVTNTNQNRSLSTDADGAFSIPANSGDVLKFKMIGFAEKTVTIANVASFLQVNMSEEAVLLNTTVVTALGISREERSLGYAVSEVSGEGLKKARETNVINSLAGKVPGLIVNSTAGGPSGSSRVIIRGNTSVTGNNQPLYVVDGMPMDNSSYGGTGTGQYAEGFDFGDAISAINPDDIETISILKGPSASALYGTRAANGVILITTKKGQGSKNLGIEFNSTSSFEKQLTKQNGFQRLYGSGRDGMLNKDVDQARTTIFNNFGPRLDPDLMAISFDGIERPYALVPDNIDGFFRTGSTFTNSLAITNSNESTSYRFSYTNLTNNDIIPNSGVDRNSFSLNGTTKIGKKLTVDAKSFYMTEQVKNRPALADDRGNIGSAFIGLANNINQSIFKEKYKNADGSYIEWGGGEYRLNPYWVLNEMENKTNKDRFMNALNVSYKINSWLDLQGRASTDITFFEFDNYTPRTTPGNFTGTLDQIRRKFVTTEADAMLSAQRKLSADFNLVARLGTSISRVHNDGNTMKFTDMTVTDAISSSSFVNKGITPQAYKKHLNSVYGLASLGYKNYLYLDATLREDISSTLPKENNSYWYPSLAGSFVFSDAFKMNSNILSFGKIRVSGAQVAGDTEPYLMDLYYSLGSLAFDGKSYGKANNDVLPNPNLKPTRTRSYEIGAELKFFKGRLNFDATYYTQKSRDQINMIPVPQSSGFATQLINAGVVSNKGVELLLSGSPIVTKNFDWNVSVNFARNKNMVESLADDVPFLTLSDARWLGVSIVAKPNEQYGSIMAYEYEKDPDGNIILKPETFLPEPSQGERVVVGKGIYDWTGGMTNTFTYKNLTLSAVVDVKYGADLFSMTNLLAAANGLLPVTLEGRDEWIKSEEQRIAQGYTSKEWLDMGNQRGYLPKGVVEVGGQYVQNTQEVNPGVYWRSVQESNASGRLFVYDASYVKMREITLGYKLPASLIRDWRIKDVQLAIVSRNPFIIYKNVPNIDPDSNYNNGNGQGLEYGSLPTRKSWGINLNFKF